jgi:hypothetical protein
MSVEEHSHTKWYYCNAFYSIQTLQAILNYQIPL